MTKLNFKHFQSLSRIQKQRQTEQAPDSATEKDPQGDQKMAEGVDEKGSDAALEAQADQNMTRQQQVYRKMAKRAEMIRAKRTRDEREQRQKRQQEERERAFETRKQSEIAAQHRKK